MHDETALGVWLEGDECRALEPGIAADCRGGVQLPQDAQVDPRRVVAALSELLGDVVRLNADVVELDERGVELADGTRIEAETVVLAAGAWSSRRLAKRLPIVPSRGEPLRQLESSSGTSMSSRGRRRDNWRDVEDAGFDTTATDDATELLLGEARRAVPAVEALELVEAVASVRPATPDGGPLIGEWEGLLVAGGHYRNGILLAPVTADAVAAMLAGDSPPPETAPFDPRRFDL